MQRLFQWLYKFVVRQRCMPWRLRIWLGKRSPKLLIFLQTGRTNINTARRWDAMWEETGPDGARWCRFPNKFARIAQIVDPGADVLDVGCGVGILLQKLQQENGCTCTGIDISPKAAETVKAKGMAALAAKLPDIPLPSNSFDVAVATELIEHLNHPEQTLEQMARVVRPGGRVIVSTPDEEMGTDDTLWHMHTFSTSSLKDLLAPHLDDIKIETIKEDGFQADFLLGWGTVKK